MKHAWPLVELGTVLHQVDRAEPSASLGEINLAGVYGFGKGLFERGPLVASTTSYKSYNRLVKGDFVISQPKAWEGAIAAVTEHFNGWYLSPVFPAFRPDENLLSLSYLHWYCQQPIVWDQLKFLSTGMGARRETVSPKQFLSLKIPLPPLEKQRQITARIDCVQQQLLAAEKLRRSATAELHALCRAVVINDPSTKHTVVAELVHQRSPDVNVEPDVSYQFAGVYSFGRGVFKGGVKTGAEFAYPKLSRVKAGDFIYPKLMAWEGALGVVPDECDDCFVSPEFPVFEIDRTKVLPDVFDVYFRDPSTWESLQGGSTGTNARRRRLNPSDFLKLKIPVPNMATQQMLAAIRLHQNKICSVNTDAECNAVLASLLNNMLRTQ